MAKEQRLISWLQARQRLAIGYSGGVDSAYLAAVAVEAVGRENVVAIIGRSASYPESQWKNARDIGERIGLIVLEIDTDELNDPRYAANPTNRCYFCKTELWRRLVSVASRSLRTGRMRTTCTTGVPARRRRARTGSRRRWQN